MLGYLTIRTATGTEHTAAVSAARADTEIEFHVADQRTSNGSPATTPRTSQYPSTDMGRTSAVSTIAAHMDTPAHLHLPSRTMPGSRAAPAPVWWYRIRPRE